MTHSASSCVSYGFTAAREYDFILSFSQVLPIVEWYWSERSAVFWSSGGSRESNFIFLGGLSIFWITISGLLVWLLSMMFPLGGVKAYLNCYLLIYILFWCNLNLIFLWINYSFSLNSFHLNSVWVVLHTRKKKFDGFKCKIFLLFVWYYYNSALGFFFSFFFLVLFL